MNNFNSLTKALEDWFDTPLCDLPEELRYRVEDEFSPMPWDQLSPSDRREICEQVDSYDDPSLEARRQHYYGLAHIVTELEATIAQWESKRTPTALDQDVKERRLQELKKLRDEHVANGMPRSAPRSLRGKSESLKPVAPAVLKKSASNVVRRDARKLETTKRHNSWKKAYRELKKEHPGKTDTWISKRIEKMDISDGKTAETIRRKMKS
jgi:hypothetical protein